jgi:hypothetical protein
MARIQILELPSVVVGEDISYPFAVVIDQVETETTQIVTSLGPLSSNRVSELTQSEADAIARNVGAVGAILTAITLDVERG